MIYINQQGEDISLRQLTIEEISNPYQIISTYFENERLEMHSQSIETLMLCATTTKQWDITSSPRPFLRVAEEFEKLMEASFLLQRDYDRVFVLNGSMLQPGDLEGVSINPYLYCSKDRKGHSWSCLPKHLKDEEFLNPYYAFINFFEYYTLSGWRKVLSDLLEFALIKDSVLILNTHNYNVLEISSLLHRIIEAAHLIDVRENKKSLMRPEKMRDEAEVGNNNLNNIDHETIG